MKSVKLTENVQRSCPNISPAFTIPFIKFLTTVPIMEKISTYSYGAHSHFLVVHDLDWERSEWQSEREREKKVINLVELHIFVCSSTSVAGNISDQRQHRRWLAKANFCSHYFSKNPPNDMWNGAAPLCYTCALMGTIDCIHCAVVSFYGHSVAITACDWIAAYVRQPHEMIKSTQKWYRSRQLAFALSAYAQTQWSNPLEWQNNNKKTNLRRFAGSTGKQTEMILYLLQWVSEA